MFKKVIITIVVIALLAGTVYGVRMYNENKSPRIMYGEAEGETVVPNDTLTPVEETGYFVAAENQALRLLVCAEDGNIQVENKDNGYVWRSCPTEEEMQMESSNTLWKNNLSSPVMFTYTTQATSTDTKYTNPLSQDSKTTVFWLENGVRVYIEFLDNHVTFGYDLFLENDGLRVEIPSYLISDPGEVYKTNPNGTKSLVKKESCLVVDFYLFPNMGAARSDMGVEGSLLVPDGLGALINFQSDNYADNQYIAHVYGADMALYNGFDTQLRAEQEKPKVIFPAYGIIRDGNTMLTVIDEGETQSDIIASKAGVQTGFNTITARFVYRMKYKVVTNAASGTGYLSFTDFCVKEKRCLKYYFGTGDYVDMAQTYRNYLCDKYDLHCINPEADEPALQLYLVGGDIESKITGKRFIPMTTFAQAEEILRCLKDAGVEKMDAVYTGWGKWGESTQVPNRFPVAKQLGGIDGLSTLSDMADELGCRVYVADDHLFLDSHKGLSVSHNAVYNIQDNPLFDGAFANSDYMLKNYGKCSNKYTKMGISGVEETGIGVLLTSDYSDTNPTTRKEMKDSSRSALLKMRDDFGTVRVVGGNVWELMDDAVITQLEGTSYLSILDENVPFYTIALHGIVDYICGDYMEFYEPESQLLDAVSKGGSVSFTLSYEGTEKLAFADSASYYSTQFDLWKDDVLAVWSRLEPYERATRGHMIIGYRVLAPGVTETEYDNGVLVIVNNADKKYTSSTGTVVPERTFIIIGGKD